MNKKDKSTFADRMESSAPDKVRYLKVTNSMTREEAIEKLSEQNKKDNK